MEIVRSPEAQSTSESVPASFRHWGKRTRAPAYHAGGRNNDVRSSKLGDFSHKVQISPSLYKGTKTILTVSFEFLNAAINAQGSQRPPPFQGDHQRDAIAIEHSSQGVDLRFPVKAHGSEIRSCANGSDAIQQLIVYMPVLVCPCTADRDICHPKTGDSS